MHTAIAERPHYWVEKAQTSPRFERPACPYRPVFA
jgi:hypothetical protein